MGANRYVNKAASGIAGTCRTVEGVYSATIGVVAYGGAIAITDFILFDNAISTTGAAVVVIIVVAASGAAPIIIFTNGNSGENADCATISGASIQRIGCAGKCIITSLGAIPIAGFSCFDDVIRTQWSTIIIVKVIAALSAAAIS